MGRILILGGTRFVGKLAASRLAHYHDLTVLSRNPVEIIGARRIVQDRAVGLAELSNERFDTVLDFIAYDQTDVPQACALADTYLAISSAWLPRLNKGTADGVVPENDSTAPSNMLAVTRRYLLGKARLEEAIHNCREQGRSAAALRLPILMGDEDHTGRLDFYRRRITDGGPLLLVDGGKNAAQLLWSEDVVRLIVSLVDSGCGGERAIWEALPDNGIKVADFVDQVAKSMGTTNRCVDAPADRLINELPAYLEAEPLWRESSLAKTEANLFTRLNVTPTSPMEWLSRLSKPIDNSVDATRSAEIAFANKLITCALN